jgi:glycyl-radical enzyme activating protein
MANLITQGMIADIQRFSLHDGPGIRTTVFLKGCNLNCAWCHNPETIAFEPQILLRPDKCIHCGKCEEGCYSGARKICGTKRTVTSVLEEVLLDKPYYGSEGGLTISGGEPLCQPDFSKELLKASRENGIHTALESNMSIPWKVAGTVLKYCDMLMCDLKLWDSEKHLQWTGAPNEIIKYNIMKASDMGLPVLLRTPVIQGINDNEDEIRNIAQFAKGIPTLIYYELLPYHPLGLSKFLLEGFEPERFERPSAEKLKGLAQVAASAGVTLRIAGKQIK